MSLLFDSFQNFTSEHEFIGTYFQILMLTTAIGFPLVSLIVFPFYVRVNRKNRKRDEQTSVFPILNYFSKSSFLTESLTLFGLLILPIIYLISTKTQYQNAFQTFFTTYWVPLFFIKMIVTITINILTSFLAIQRFLLYFFPKIKRLVPVSRKMAKWLIIGLHLPICIVVCLALSSSINKHQKTIDRILQILHFTLNFLVILTSLPYFLMIFSLRKLTHISNIQSKPEKYIKCQILIILFSKLLIIPFLFTMKVDKKSEEMGAPKFILQLVCETLITPLMIQSAYLLSNKVNLDTLKSSVGFVESIRKVVSRRNTKVEPTVFTVPSVYVISDKKRSLTVSQ